jgi:polyhydroxybutyrate depolymerase
MKTIKPFFICAFLMMGSFFLNAQQQINSTLVCDGNTRSYTIYIPASYNGEVAFPLLFNFHGGGGDIQGHLSLVDMRPIADTANVILVYPQAFTDPENGDATWMHKEPTDHDDVLFVEAMLSAISSEYNVNLNRIYACGYSNGGEFAYDIACRMNASIAAVGAVARTMYMGSFNNCAPVHPTGILTILGTADATSDYNGINFGGIQYYLSADDVHDYWANFNNCDPNPVMTNVPNIDASDGSTVEKYSWSDANGCTYVEHFKVVGGGHDWPGVFGNMDIDASQEIWRFVSRYDLSGLIDCNSSSVNEMQQNLIQLKVYPNPTQGNITVDWNEADSAPYQMYSIMGELVQFGELHNGSNTLSTHGLSANVYLIKVGQHTQRIIKNP